MKVILNQHIKNGKVEDQWAHVIGSNNRPHRINSYSTVTESTIKRLIRNAASVELRTYDGEEGQGYIFEITFKL